MSQTKAQLLGPVLGDSINFDSGTLFVDSTNNRVGIGVTNPQDELHLGGTSNVGIRLEDTTPGGGSYGNISYNDNGSGINALSINADAGNTGANSEIRFAIDGNDVSRYAVGGELLVGAATTTTGTASQKLQVTGGAYISGSVGIGTTNPIAIFQIGPGNFTGGAASNAGFAFDVNGQVLYTTYGDAGNLTLRANRPSVNGGGMVFLGSSNRGDYLVDSAYLSTTNTIRLFVNGSGNVGIGVTNPLTRLQVEETVAGGKGALISIINRSSTIGTKCGIMFGVDGSGANWSDVGNAQIIMENTSGASTGQLKFSVFDSADSEAMKIVGNGSGNYRNGVAFARAGVALDNSWDGFPGIAVFNTDGYGNTSNKSEFRIHGINQSYASYPGGSGLDFGTNLRIDGSTYFSSDARHKTNIVDNPYGLNEILQLQPRKFNRINSDGQIEENQGDILGFIAQEVKEIIPEAVNYYPEEDNPNEIGWCRAYSLSDSYIVSTLVNAVKQQQEIIDGLKSRIETLESQINT